MAQDILVFLLFECQPLKIWDPHAAEEPIYETIEETGLELKEGKPLILRLKATVDSGAIFVCRNTIGVQ